VLFCFRERLSIMGCGSSKPTMPAGDGHYFSFKTGGSPADVVDRFIARFDGNTVTYYRNGPVGSTAKVDAATAHPMESYSIKGNNLTGPVTAKIQSNGDIVYSHGYTSRREADSEGKPLGGGDGSGKWVVYKNIDMCFQGDAEIIGDWRAKTSIGALRKKVAAKGYSAVCVGSFGHAALKSFPYQLTKGHMKPSQGYTNEIHVYYPKGNAPKDGTHSDEMGEQAAAENDEEVVDQDNTAGKSLFLLKGADFVGRDDRSTKTPCKDLKEAASLISKKGNAGSYSTCYALRSGAELVTIPAVGAGEMGNGAKWSGGRTDLIVCAKDTGHRSKGKMLIALEDVDCCFGDGQVFHGVHTYGDALKVVKQKDNVSMTAYFWHSPSNRLIEKPKGKGANWVGYPGYGWLFLWADEKLLDLDGGSATISKKKFAADPSFSSPSEVDHGAGAGPKAPQQPDACKLILTTRGAANQLVFEDTTKLGAHTPHVKLTLSSHPGCAIVVRVTSGPHHVGHPWMAEELGVGRAENAATATFDDNGFLVYSHGTAPGKVLDVSMWRYEVGNDVNFVGSQHDRHETFKGGGGRTFTLNGDGTMSPAHAPHLVLGLSQPDCTLVEKTSAEKLVLDAKAADMLREGVAAPLTLSSHPGCAIVPKTDQPRRIDEWHISYQHLGVGPASHAMKVKQEGAFLLSAHPATTDFILDVPFGSLNVHCHGVHGPLPIAAINIERGENKEHHNAARLFVLNADNTISPTKAPHLVFGIRGTLVESEAQPTFIETVVHGVAAVMGMPIEASEAAASASSERDGPSLTLAEMVECLKKQLSLEGEKSMHDVVHSAAAELGIAVKGKALFALAKECLEALGFNKGTE